MLYSDKHLELGVIIMKKVIVLSALIVTFSLLFFTHTEAINNSLVIKTLPNGGNLYAEDQTSVLEKLPANSILFILEEQSFWSKVQVNESIGFVKNAAMSSALSSLMKISSSSHPIIRQTNDKNAKHLATTHNGAYVRVYLQTQNGFSLIQTDQAIGYVYSSTLVKPVSINMTVAHKNGAAIRNVPDMNYSIQNTLSNNSAVTAYPAVDGWFYVESKGIYGYALANKLKKDTKQNTNSGVKRIALTFDDGPHPTVTRQILKTLAKYDAKATFFVTGRRVELSPTVLKEIYAAGHEIGNHTFNHPKLTNISLKSAKEQITSTNALISKTIGQEATVFRPPYGAYNKNIQALTDLPFVLWTVDTLDWQHHDPNKTLQAVKKQTKNGSIILMHDIHQSTANGLDSVLHYLSNEGYEFVTVSELQAK